MRKKRLKTCITALSRRSILESIFRNFYHISFSLPTEYLWEARNINSFPIFCIKLYKWLMKRSKEFEIHNRGSTFNVESWRASNCELHHFNKANGLYPVCHITNHHILSWVIMISLSSVIHYHVKGQISALTLARTGLRWWRGRVAPCHLSWVMFPPRHICSSSCLNSYSWLSIKKICIKLESLSASFLYI